MTFKKNLIKDKPNIGDLSQYNFENASALYQQINYDDSTSIPKRNDKFQGKDLYTTAIGDRVNEALIERNIKFEGGTNLTINNLYISNTGADGTVKNVYVIIWLFTELAYGSDPTKDGYHTLMSKLGGGTKGDDFRIYASGFGNKSEGQDLGNISEVEGVPTISNFGIDSPEIIYNQFTGGNLNLDEDSDNFALPRNIVLETEDSTNYQTQIFNQNTYNPLYLCIWTRGDKKVAWPVNTDSRRKVFSLYKINNKELFNKSGDFFSGKNTTLTFNTPTKTRQGDGGGGAVQAAWRVSNLSITINTAAGVKNTFSDINNYKDIVSEVLPPVQVGENIFNSVDWLATLHPKNQLNNKQLSGENEGALRHKDFLPATTFGLINTDIEVQMSADGLNITSEENLITNFVDLQSYHEDDLNKTLKASIPAKVAFKITPKSLHTKDLSGYDYYEFGIDEFSTGLNTNSEEPSGLLDSRKYYYYFVIDWDDKNNKFKTIDDFLEDKPINEFEYLQKQQKNLYIVRCATEQVGAAGYDPISNPHASNLTPFPTAPTNTVDSKLKGLLSNQYTTPGIKTVKFIVISAYSTDTFSTSLNPDTKLNLEFGRWKLCTSRFYLDISPNQYPDFSDVGGNDYSTIPWPFTTPIVGGVSENSNYKISVQNTIAGGKVGRDDIIDEKFLVKDIENDEMGKSINNLDLEQVRYFNTGSFDMTRLLNIENINFFMGSNTYTPYTDISQSINQTNQYWNGSTIERSFSEETSVGQIFINDNQDISIREKCVLELNTGELTNKSIYDSSVNSNKGLLIGDYKVKKVKKGQPMRRDSFIKVPKKANNKNGAL